MNATGGGHSEEEERLVEQIFEDIDTDGNGTLDLEEFKQMQQQSAELLVMEEEMKKIVCKEGTQNKKRSLVSQRL
jgi:Ca2+-binding EF-hand superfamily protein